MLSNQKRLKMIERKECLELDILRNIEKTRTIKNRLQKSLEFGNKLTAEYNNVLYILYPSNNT